MNGLVNQLATDSTFTIVPPPLFASTGANRCTIDRHPKKFVSISCRAAVSASSPSMGESRSTPALFTRMVMS